MRPLRSPSCNQVARRPVKVLATIYVACLLVPTCCGQAEKKISGTDLEFLGTENGTYAVRPHTVVAGEVLVHGANKLQPNLLACAVSCDQEPSCSAVNYCNIEGGCSAGTSGAVTIPVGACELLVPTKVGVILVQEAASGDVSLGTTGLRLAYSDPGQADGYVKFSARSLKATYDLYCQGSVSPSMPSCVRLFTLQEAVDFCDAWPECQAFVFTPRGIALNLSAPMASFKGWPAGTVVGINASSYLTDRGLTYVKQAALAGTGGGVPQAAPAAPSNSAGLSSGAIAGIAVGASAACLAAALAAAVLWRRRRPTPDAPGQLKPPEPSMAGAKQGSFRSSRHSGASSHGAGIGPGIADAGPELDSAFSCNADVELGGKGGSGPGLGPGQAEPPPAADPRTPLMSAMAGRAVPPMPPALHAAMLGRSFSGDTNCTTPRTPGVQLAKQGSLEAEGSQDGGSSCSSSLLSRLPDESWSNCVVEASQIEFCQNADGKAVELGRGAFSTVYKVMLDGVQPMAAKCLRLGEDPRLAESFIKEVSILRQLRHRNITAFVAACVIEGSGIILMELMDGRDLHSCLSNINKAGERVFGWYNRGKTVVLDIARALHYLHSLNLTHFDIKSSNVLLSRDLTAKLADVGFTKAMRRTHHSLSSNAHKGTFDYMAPELLLGRPCTNKVDCYSFGCLLWEIVTGEYPSRGCMRALRVPEECPQPIADLYLECVDEDPDKRPTAKQLVQRITRLPGRGPSGGR